MATSDELGPLAQLCHRTTGFKDTAGVKDAAGKGINLTLYDGKLFTPHGVEYLDKVKSVKIRPDDIILSGYVKTGCHWVWETLGMILKGKGEYSPFCKQIAYLEMAAPELYDNLDSPRILNTHHEYDYLPDEVKEKKTKIVLTTRNPKDTAVSLYNHQINLYEVYNYDGQFQDWFPLFLDGKVDNGSFFDYYVSWERAINEHPDHPILVVKYEDMKKDLKSTIRKLADFVNVTLSNDQVDEIAKKAEFSSMKQKFKGLSTEKLIRKGEVGDWKTTG
ncbi:unnamed protein product [Candidula unifasciata]|uniref:Sulfotransferase domain-containing protein n=1 Tax=Candidula unifasciata TaxID=100452 RepID=A0A8S3YC85_9EUPU|nr:unnamed protein product [Candidula unifasciata]